jgi:hypothetical protein
VVHEFAPHAAKQGRYPRGLIEMHGASRLAIGDADEMKTRFTALPAEITLTTVIAAEGLQDVNLVGKQGPRSKRLSPASHHQIPSRFTISTPIE